MSSTKSITARLCNVDVVIVGAGIAGSALALGLARRGFSVLLLEKTREHHDRVRGESMVPWGVAEADKLGVLDVLVAAGGHYTPLGLPYGEGVAPEAARARAIDVSKALPNVQGSMTFSHPKVCQALNDAAQAAGAVVLREVKQVVVTPGTAPRVTFALDTRYCEVSSRVIVGADGRGSIVARQIGAQVQTAPDHHFMAGLVVEDCTAWPEQEFAVGTDGDVTFYVFPQGNGRIRLYLCYGLNQAHRFAGPGNVRRFLGALRLSSLPHSNALSSATAAGPCRGYPNADSWIDIPVAPGVVLIGDAAGHNDPTIGQGLSSAFRDARTRARSPRREHRVESRGLQTLCRGAARANAPAAIDRTAIFHSSLRIYAGSPLATTTGTSTDRRRSECRATALRRVQGAVWLARRRIPTASMGSDFELRQVHESGCGPSRQAAFFAPTVANGAQPTWLDL